MTRKLFIAFYIVLSLFITCYAEEQITSYDNSTLPVLNEQLRKLSDGISRPKSLTSSWLTGILPVSKGGLGASSWTQYLIPYADTTTSFSQIAIGNSGQALMSNGAGAAPSFQSIPGNSASSVIRSSGQYYFPYPDFATIASLSLPSAGTYLIFTSIAITPNGAGTAQVQLYNNTDSAAVANSYRKVAIVAGTFTSLWLITVDSADDIYLQGISSVNQNISVDPGTSGMCEYGYVKLY